METDAHAAALRTRARFVEAICPAPIIVWSQALRVGKAGDDEVLMTEDLCRVDLPVKLVEDGGFHVRRWRNKPVCLEDRSQP